MQVRKKRAKQRWTGIPIKARKKGTQERKKAETSKSVEQNLEKAITLGPLPSFLQSNEKKERDEGDAMLIDYLERQLGIKNDIGRRCKVQADIAKTEFGGEDLLGFADQILESDVYEAKDEATLPSDAKKVHQTSKGSDLGDFISENNPGLTAVREQTDSVVTQEPSRYVPPRKREVPGQEKINTSATGVDLKLKLRSCMNRVAEGNLNIILSDIVSFVKSEKENLELNSLETQHDQEERRSSDSGTTIAYSVTQYLVRVSKDIADISFSFLEARASAGLLAPQIAMLCGLTALISPQILVNYCCLAFHKLAREMSALWCESWSSTGGHFDPSSIVMDDCRRILTSIGLIAYFGLLGPDLVLALGRYIIHGTASGPDTTQTSMAHAEIVRRLDLLSVLLRTSGTEFKTSFPEHYKILMTEIESLFTSLGDTESVQVGMLKHEFTQPGRWRQSPMYQKYNAMRAWLHSKGGSFKTVTWSSLTLDTSFASSILDVLHAFLQGKIPEVYLELSKTNNLSASVQGNANSKLSQAAVHLRLKTPFQQQVFVALVDAVDPEDAAYRTVKLARHRSDVLNIISVIVHCAIHERLYNPFYKEVFTIICNSSDEQIAHRFKRGIRQGFHAMVNSLNAQNNTGEILRKKAMLIKIVLDLSDVMAQDARILFKKLAESIKR